MSMPNNLVIVRHGESEANIVQKAEKSGQDFEVPNGFYDRHDWEHRLSERGVQQAKSAGEWILNNIGEPSEFFDKAYVSPFMRARETAAYVGGKACEWLVDDRLRERDWGIYGATPLNERKQLFSKTEELREMSRWYTRLDGGDSMAGEMLLSTRDFFGTLHRDAPDKNVLVVAHGDRMGSIRFQAEHMLPEEWEEADSDVSQRINNGGILWYRRTSPESEDATPHISWRRMVYPDDIDNSPFGGDWIELPGKVRRNGETLLSSVEKIQPLLERD